jgi:NADH:ubiquinone oxidoreductase subunit D
MEAVLSYTLMLGPEHPAWRGLQRYTLALKGEHVTEIECREPLRYLFNCTCPCLLSGA